MLAIAWTTTAQLSDAERLGRELIETGLASCVQIDGPVLSVYRWQGKTETTEGEASRRPRGSRRIIRPGAPSLCDPRVGGRTSRPSQRKVLVMVRLDGTS
jgi:hypothetical protein